MAELIAKCAACEAPIRMTRVQRGPKYMTVTLKFSCKPDCPNMPRALQMHRKIVGDAIAADADRRFLGVLEEQCTYRPPSPPCDCVNLPLSLTATITETPEPVGLMELSAEATAWFFSKVICPCCGWKGQGKDVGSLQVEVVADETTDVGDSVRTHAPGDESVKATCPECGAAVVAEADGPKGNEPEAKPVKFREFL